MRSYHYLFFFPYYTDIVDAFSGVCTINKINVIKNILHIGVFTDIFFQNFTGKVPFLEKGLFPLKIENSIIFPEIIETGRYGKKRRRYSIIHSKFILKVYKSDVLLQISNKNKNIKKTLIEEFFVCVCETYKVLLDCNCIAICHQN